jgi:hypothetical protein
MEVSGRVDHRWSVIFHRHGDPYDCLDSFVTWEAVLQMSGEWSEPVEMPS